MRYNINNKAISERKWENDNKTATYNRNADIKIKQCRKPKTKGKAIIATCIKQKKGTANNI